MKKFLKMLLPVLLTLPFTGEAQNRIEITARLVESDKTLFIQQDIYFKNNSNDTLTQLYFNDWAHSFSSKQSKLGRRFAENYDRRFHLADDYARGASKINTIIGERFSNLSFKRLEDAEDVLEINLLEPLPPGQTTRRHVSSR